MDDPTLIIERYNPAPPPPPRRTKGMLILWTLFAGMVAATVGGALLLVWLTTDLPPLERLQNYRARTKQATLVYGMRGDVIGRFAKERRTIVASDQIPRVLANAVIASEDAGFYDHKGVDYLGIARCLIKNVLSGRKRCGGSTITQQTVKTFFLTPKKTYIRKLKELVLAKRVEESLSKEHILYLYLNQIYFGHGAYGVQEAARVYFGKDIDAVNLAEAALLAGLPQSPSRLDPYRHPERARKRRTYVLGRMLEVGFISEKAFVSANESTLELDWGRREQHLNNQTHFMAEIRRLLSKHPLVGQELLLTGGLAIHTGLDPTVQAASDAAIASGVEALDKRQGFRGALLELDAPRAKALSEALDQRLEEFDRQTKTSSASAKGPVVFDLSPFRTAAKNLSAKQLAELARATRLTKDEVYGGLVQRVEDAQRRAVIGLGRGIEVMIPLRPGLKWARRFDLARYTAPPRRASDVLSPGDVVLVRVLEKKGDAWIGQLEQRPEVQAALVVIDPRTREVRALSGGYGSGAGTFNRAVQARRQAGSTFKPFVYATALDLKAKTPISECLDAPFTVYDPYLRKKWQPKNYSGRFDGRMTLRRALSLSKNLCSVRLLDEIGVAPVIAFAKKLGVRSEMPRNLTLSLGSGDVTPLEMVNAYATLADAGRFAEPIFIRKVLDASGKVLIESEYRPESAISEEVSFQITSMMTSVVEEGSAQAVQALNRPVAGKTGTTNEARNAWFIGYTPQLVAGVWVGFDDNRPLGPNESGGRAAIPIWLDVMKAAHEGIEPTEFAAPSSIIFALVDPSSGKLAPPHFMDAREEPFRPGTEPTEFLVTDAPDWGLELEDQ